MRTPKHIEVLKEAVAAGDGLRDQIAQMREMFDDSDGAIANALKDWDDAARIARSHFPASVAHASQQEEERARAGYIKMRLP